MAGRFERTPDSESQATGHGVIRLTIYIRMYTIGGPCEETPMLAHSPPDARAAARPAGSLPHEAERCSSGCPALDRLLPQGGFRRGSLVEWCAAARGGGAGTLALLAAREACRSGGTLVVLDRRREFYPPAAVVWGLELSQLLIVRPREKADKLWAWDQALRCPAVAAVWGSLRELDGRAFRRLQLAAEQGRGLGLLLRPAAARDQPSWADVRLFVQPLAGEAAGQSSRHTPCAVNGTRSVPATMTGRRLRVQVLRCRRGQAGAEVELELDEALGTIREAPRREMTILPLREEAG